MSAFIPWEEKQVKGATCDKCGIIIEGSVWGFAIDTWIAGDRWVHWQAELCADCKEALVVAIADFGVTFSYHRE